ncbi:MAG: terminase large subunit [Clostridiales Family XIII bacterium]|nr:terminase large subunit [Clostridiales Family XIII bacterium]
MALWNCTYWKESGLPRWPELLCVIGRGAGKDGYIAWDSLCMISPYNKDDRYYDVDICANVLTQSQRPLKDVLNALEDDEYRAKLEKHFIWNCEAVTAKKNGGMIQPWASQSRNLDGLRSGKVVLNEIHGFENYALVNVFTTGLGKKKSPRIGYFSTLGDVRDGPLDHYMERAKNILDGEEPDDGMLPFICRLDSEADVRKEKMWVKANPSLPYKDSLRDEIRREYKIWKRDPQRLPSFMVKRMNVLSAAMELTVTDYENIPMTNTELPDLAGAACTVGIDYMKTSDFLSVNAHFRDGDMRYDINHSWVCAASKDLPRIRAPWREWAAKGLLTVIDDIEINPAIVAEYISGLAQKYYIEKVALDGFRYAVLASALRGIGFDNERKNIKLVKPTDIMKTAPVIESCFVNGYFVWGDNPVLRWAVGNTKMIRSGVKAGTDTGNYVYAKIEAKSRKTDPFMALVASMVIEDEVEVVNPNDFTTYHF